MSEAIKKVLANCPQSFSGQEKVQARNNIGALGGVKVQTSSGTSELVPDENGKVTVDLTDAGGASYSGGDGIDVNPSSHIITAKTDGVSVTCNVNGELEAHNTLVGGSGIDIDTTNHIISAKADGTSITYNADGELEAHNTLIAGGGIDINANNNIIAAKADGTSITYNADGELEAHNTLIAGGGIDIDSNNNIIAAKADGTTITYNANGELQATGSLPAHSAADSGNSLVVDGTGDLIWGRRISGVIYNGNTPADEMRRLRINTYNDPSSPGTVIAFPVSGQGSFCGTLMPEPGFVADGTVDKVARVKENPNNSGVCMLEYQDDAAVISPLEKVSISTSTNPYQIDAQPGKWYEIVCSQSTAQSWHIYLEANSTVTKNTVHTIVRITRTDASVSCSPSLVWHDERGIIHYEQCDLTGSTSYYDFDCLVRKNGYTVEGIPWSFARVRRI